MLRGVSCITGDDSRWKLLHHGVDTRSTCHTTTIDRIGSAACTKYDANVKEFPGGMVMEGKPENAG